MSRAQTVSAEFAAVLVTIYNVRACGGRFDAAMLIAARRHHISVETATALYEARELRELERLAMLAESQNLSALLRRQGN